MARPAITSTHTANAQVSSTSVVLPVAAPSQPATGLAWSGTVAAPVVGPAQPAIVPTSTGFVAPQTQPNAAASIPAGSANPGVPSYASGLGTRLGGVWTLTAYGCFRSGTRVFCDFDLSESQTNQGGTLYLFAGVTVVDDGGKITGRHNAFFLFNDGSQANNAYFSPGNPVRYIMEYDDVNPNHTSISLVNGGDRIQGVPISPLDPSLPAGSMPARRGPNAQGQSLAALYTKYRFDTKHFFHPCTLPLAKMVWIS